MGVLGRNVKSKTNAALTRKPSKSANANVVGGREFDANVVSRDEEIL